MENKNEKYEKYKAYEGHLLDKRYVLEHLIGVGGMAVVFRAKDLVLNNMTVAVKMLKEEAALDEVVVKRFKNEGKAQSSLEHPNIVRVFDVSVKGELKYMVMEYVYGITLKNYLVGKKGPLSFEEIMSYGIQILSALSQAHENLIIHRDIKPQNIMVLKTGQIKMMDFGIAKLPNTETVTVTDKAIGTVYYMSPEQARGKKIDARTDIYSFGAMLYELCTGKTPFNGESPCDILVKHITEKPVPPRSLNSSIPVGLEQIILCAMSKSPDDRFDTAKELLGYMKQLQKNNKIKFTDLPSNSFFSNMMSRIKGAFSKKKGRK
ncbi:MAG: serine/threonine protein kinase [Ruminococcaceae bacterium]|nr:serine/threonine protein kinase [Oscillospiraceae bacterium]